MTGSSSASAVRRDPPCGPVDGVAQGGVASFLGIPFAEPPVAGQRFLAPRPKAPWSDLRNCTAYGHTAPQPDREFTLIPEPEEPGDDYLNLNVFAPAKLVGQPLPVMVYFHGGGYFAGCNRSPWFEGDTFVRNGVIVVSPSYRLNVEGFMPVDGAPLNRALLDWIVALEWVRDNIGAFGGDPAQVTIAGQSAGAGAVATLMAAPLAKGLFHRAVLFSGSVGFGGSIGRAQDFGARFGKAVGRPLTVEALASLSRAELVAGYEKASPEPAARRPGEGFVRNIRHGLPLQPLAGTDTLPKPPDQAFADGASGNIPALLTTTQDEFVFEFEPLGAGVTDSYLSEVLELFNLDEAAVRALYPDYRNARLLGQVATDLLMRAPMTRMAEIRRIAGAAPTWTAEFRRRSPVSLATPLRAAHCLDMPFYFDKLGLPSAVKVCGTDAPQALADQMHRSIVEFVKGRSPGWLSWAETRATRIWDWPEGSTIRDLAQVCCQSHGKG